MGEEENKNSETKPETKPEEKSNAPETKPEIKEINTEQLKKQAVSDLLKTVGVEDEERLKALVSSALQQEESNKTDLQKSQGNVTKLEKELLQEREARTLAEAKLAALSSSANPDLLDDLIVVAKAKVTNDKDINTVIEEIKKSPAGKYYFKTEEEENKPKKKTVKVVTKKDPQMDHQKDEKYSGTFAERFFSNRAEKKSTYF